MLAPALLALALLAGADPCVADAGDGRTFRVCFAPGDGLLLSAAQAAGGREPARGGALDLGVALRLRSDRSSPAGRPEWLRDQAVLEGRARFTAGDDTPRAARGVVWSAVFVRKRAEPFLLVPGPRPIRLPFPFDVGLRFDAGGAAWDAAREREVDLVPLRAALLLDVARHARIRRLAFGPELAWAVRVARGTTPDHRVVPFSAGVLDARAETRDGLWAASLLARAGTEVRAAGGTQAFADVALSAERVVLAVNDRPVAAFVEAAWRGGAAGRGGEVAGGLRLGLFR